jgi:hypothetical protein
MEKMKNTLIKTCLTGIVLSVAGLANADEVESSVTIFTPQLTSHAVISGGALNIAADSQVDGNLAAQAAVTIGAGLNSQAQNIYAGAAVTTGALSTVKNIIAGAAATIGASAHAQNVKAGAAITIGAGGEVHNVVHGAAFTLGVGASSTEDGGNTVSLEELGIYDAESMASAIEQIGIAQVALSTLTDATALHTTYSGLVSLEPGVHQGSAVNIAANSVVEFRFDGGGSANHVWIINISEALTVGAGTVFRTEVGDGTATIIWNVGAALTLGAGTEFIGSAFVNGTFNAATSDVSCGNIYATGPVSVGSVGALELNEEGVYNPVGCDTNAQGSADFEIVVGELREQAADNQSASCPIPDSAIASAQSAAGNGFTLIVEPGGIIDSSTTLRLRDVIHGGESYNIFLFDDLGEDDENYIQGFGNTFFNRIALTNDQVTACIDLLVSNVQE